MEASLGGTEIFAPLNNIYNNIKQIKSYDRLIFLLTDGDVWDTKQVI